jgi:hypothetical protein
LTTHHGQTESVISTRASLLEVVAVAVCVALGVNCLAAGIALQLRFSGWALIGLGASLAALGGAYLVARAAPRINGKFSFEGILPVKGKQHEVIGVNRYEFAEKAARYFRALTFENRALGKAWSENPLSPFDFDFKAGRATRKSSPAVKLVREAVEYFVLEELSLHLSGHFENNPNISEHELIKVGRREIPSVLLENRFLELFSKPMDEREAFVEPPGRLSEFHKVVSATGKGGAIFEHFELILPQGAQVLRVDPASIRVQTKRFSMQIVVSFDGFGAVFPRSFETLYLGTKLEDVHAYKVDLDIDIHFSPWSLFTARGWEYYKWLDSFLDRVEETFSSDRFFQDIGWETALSAAIIQRHMGRVSQLDVSDSPQQTRPDPPETGDKAGQNDPTSILSADKPHSA